MSSVHTDLKSTIESKYSNDKVEYASPAGDTAFTDRHQFIMHSEELDTDFRVIADDWRSDNPEYKDTYLSVKYSSEAENKIANIISEYIPEHKITYSGFYTTELPIDTPVDLSFDDWWSMVCDIAKTIKVDILVPIDGINTSKDSIRDYYLEDYSNQIYQAHSLQSKLNTLGYNFLSLEIKWVSRNEYTRDLNDLSKDIVVSNAYYAWAVIDTKEISWLNLTTNSWQNTPNAIGTKPADHLNNIEGMTGSDLVGMPDIEELNKKLYKGGE